MRQKKRDAQFLAILLLLAVLIGLILLVVKLLKKLFTPRTRS